MNYEEREKTLCNNCEAKENCSYINRNLERECSFKETTMYGWELGWQDGIDKAVEWLYQRQTVDLEVSDIEKFINDFKNEMESKYENK